MPDISSSQITQNSNSSNVTSQSSSNNFSPWEERLDTAEVGEQKKPTQSIVGTFGDSGVIQNKPAQSSVPNSQLPTTQNQPLVIPEIEETIGKKMPAEQYLKPGVAASISQQPQPLGQVLPAQPIVTPAPASTVQSQSVNPIRNDITPNTVDKSGGTETQRPLTPPPVPVRDDDSGDNLFSNKKSKKSWASLGRLGSLIFTILFFVIISIVLTETGLFSISFEKVYGAIGLERLWGGLSATADKAVARSFVAMEKQSDVKIRGGISLKVSDNGKSPIIDPLLMASKINVSLFKDEEIGGVITQAVKAIYESNGVTDALVDDDVFSNWEENNSSIPAGTEASGSIESSVTSQQSDQLDTQSDDYLSAESSVLETENSEKIADQPTDELLFDLTGAFSKDGSEVILQGKNNVGEKYFDSLLLRKAEDKLWVKSAVSKFSSNSDPNSWMLYNLPQLGSQSIYKTFFANKTNSELVLVGHRISNADFMGVRCFKYQIDSLRIGDQFKESGLTQSMVKSISGEITIGIRDKLIRKINLSIVPNSETISLVSVFLDFYDYGTKNNFITPDQGEVKVAEGAQSPASTLDPVISSTATNSNDIRRKSDLSTIADTIAAYKAAKGSYPIAKSYTKLNETNSLTRMLVPKYASAIASDPKFAEGWWYGYRSDDGSSYSISARLEDQSDLSGQFVDGIYLYILTDGLSATSAAISTSQTVPADNDTRRKDDLLLVKTALNTYYLRFSRYPIARDYVRLDSKDNPIEEILVPDYLSAMPEDPKSGDGWFYAYKSEDGKSYTLSARLEDATDSEGVIVGGNNLYFLDSK